MDQILNQAVKIKRDGYIAQKIVFVDGQPGCGKTLFSPVIAALDRMELLNYAYELEYVGSLYNLGKITDDAAYALVGIFTDLKLYNTMMSRETNFRWQDLSSIFRDVDMWTYIKRLFLKGDAEVLDRIRAQQPILNLTTHNLLPFSEPIYSVLGDRCVFIEIVRHPLYMLKQNVLNMKHLFFQPNDFTVYIDYQGQIVPHYTLGWESDFLNANAIDRTVICIKNLKALYETRKKMLKEKYQAKFMTIPFEPFVYDPEPYLREMETLIGTKVIAKTRAMLRKQKVPRRMIASGLNLPVYRRCGWEPPKSKSEMKEYERRRNYAIEQGISEKVLADLDQLCSQYEQNYYGKELKRGEHYE